MSDELNDTLLKRLLKVLVAYQLVSLLILGIWVWRTFNHDDWTVMGVPQIVLEWSLIGAIAGALFRLSSYPRLSATDKAQLYLWVIAKPFVGVAFGGVVYFVAVGGVLVLQGSADVDHPQLLAALGFLAAFSDRFGLSVLERLSLSETGGGRSRRRNDAILVASESAAGEQPPAVTEEARAAKA
jgi:hypothetical protein